ACGVIAQHLRIRALAAIIKLVERPGGELAHRVAHEVEAADPKEEDDVDPHPQQEIVALENRVDARPLDLYGAKRAVFQRRAMNLADGGRRYRLIVEIEIQVTRRRAKNFHKYLFD